MDRNKMLDDLEEIFLKVSKEGFKGSNELELHLREEIADYVIESIPNSSIDLHEGLRRLTTFQLWLGSNYTTLPTNSIEMTERAVKYLNDTSISTKPSIQTSDSCSLPSDVLDLLETISSSDERLYQERARTLLRRHYR